MNSDSDSEYLYGVTFEVRTDNNPLTYLLTLAKLDATGHRWLSALSTYSFSLKYRPGRKNVEADSLSRRPYFCEVAVGDWEEISESGVRSLCQAAASGETARVGSCPFESSWESEATKAHGNVVSLTPTLARNSDADLREAQGQDPCLNKIILAISQNKPYDSMVCDLLEFHLWKREWGNLMVLNGLLYRVVTPEGGHRRQQVVLPPVLCSDVLNSLHDDNGHFGFDITYALVKDRFYWPGMKEAVKHYCRGCERCVVRKTLPRKTASMQHMQSSGPLDLVCIDFLTIEADRHNMSNVLVVTDHFTRYAQAFPARDQKALTVAKILCEKYFVHYGLPTRIHSDQGPDFESRLVKDMLAVLGIKKSRTTPYHPQGDPQPERFNRTLLNMLGTLDPKKKAQWSQYIPQLVHAYNCTQHEATGYSPYFLMFGHEPSLPVDIGFGTNKGGGSVSPSVYVQNLRRNLRAAHELAAEAAERKNLSNKRRYDQKVHECVLNPGDRVFIRNLGLRGKHKLADRWSSVIYVVDKQLTNLPVYQLTPEKGDVPKKVLHKDHILPVSSHMRVREEGKVTTCGDVPKRNKLIGRKLKDSDGLGVQEMGAAEVGSESDSDSESEYDYGPFLYGGPSLFYGERAVTEKEKRVDENLEMVPERSEVEPELGEKDGGFPADQEEEIVRSEFLKGLDHIRADPECVGCGRGYNENAGPVHEMQLRRSNRERKPPARFTSQTWEFLLTSWWLPLKGVRCVQANNVFPLEIITMRILMFGGVIPKLFAGHVGHT